MPRVWLDVAEAIGVDAFLCMWRILDREQSMHTDSESQIEVRLRRYRSYQRYSRNRYVEALFRQGLNARQIQHLLLQQLCETTCISNILRLRPKR